MIQALESNELDAALVLTEAVAHAQNQGKEIEPMAIYVESPLVWGIFSGAKNRVEKVEIAPTIRYAISRFGSGSHLMAQVDAFMRGEKIEDDQFIPVSNLEGATQSLQNLETDLFFWEKWMTKPLVDNGMLKMVDERPTPWSCFTLVGRKDFLKDEQKRNSLKSGYLEVLQTAKGFHLQEGAYQQLATAYGLKPDDCNQWLKTVRWAENWITPESQLEIAHRWLDKVNT